MLRGKVQRKRFKPTLEQSRVAAAEAALKAAADKAAKNKNEGERLARGLVRTDPATLRRELSSGPPDVMSLYQASSSQLAGARRKRRTRSVR